jgi:hypothetical protein
MYANARDLKKYKEEAYGITCEKITSSNPGLPSVSKGYQALNIISWSVYIRMPDCTR